jgi:hypothetical protein
MSEFLVEKTVTVTQISNTIELATGDLMYTVFFGEFIDVTPEVLSRIPGMSPANYPGKKLGAVWFTLNLKTDKVPYKVGSKWTLKIQENGIVSLAELE